MLSLTEIVRQNIIEQRRRRAMSQAELARAILAAGGEISAPAISLIHPPPLPPDEHSLLTHYRTISADEQRRVRAFAAGLAGTAPGAPSTPSAPSPLPQDEQELLAVYRQLGDKTKVRLRGYAEGMLEAEK